ncbi:MAG: cell division protein, partial [Alloprevotella tannerae]|nr:cell division protein [Alloprevotella tannerae]
PAFIRKHLIPLGIFLRDNELWDKQIEQINVSEDHKLTLIPRLGDQVILFGSPDNIAQKFNNLRAFYEKVMPKVGWNKYSRINLENTNQIVCTKRTANKK